MSYMRGDVFIWSTKEGHHIWVATPDPAMVQMCMDSQWAHGQRDKGHWVSGVYIDNDTLDELVAMRYAEQDDKSARMSRLRAIVRHHGNFGCHALMEQEGLSPEWLPDDEQNRDLSALTAQFVEPELPILTLDED